MARDSSGPKNEPRYDPNGVPADAADLTEVAAYAALVGNHKILTSAQRQALSGSDRWIGLLVSESDTANLMTYQYTSGGWVHIGDLGTWSTVAPNTGWAVTAGPVAAIRYRKRGDVVELLPTEFVRSGSGLSVPAGANITVGELPAGFRPATTTFIGSGSIGVAGTLGASRWYVTAAGLIQFQSLVATGTMATSGGIQNHVGLSRSALTVA